MYELIQAGDHSYYMDCPTKVGFYEYEEGTVALIDSGSDKSSARKVRQILDAKGWKVGMILNTHFHSDHIGGNRYLQSQTGAKCYCPGLEADFAQHPVLEPMMLYGGNPLEELKTKFLMAEDSDTLPLTPEVLPEGLEMIALPGHSMEMVGFRTKDGVVYLADCLSSLATLEKYHVGVLYDLDAYQNTLRSVMEMEATLFVPAHAEATSSIKELAEANIRKTEEICSRIQEICTTPSTFEEILQRLFLSYGLVMNASQYVLVGSTVRSYLTTMKKRGQLDYQFENARMEWVSL